MSWRKLGHLFVAEGQQPWMKSHAAHPQALRLSGSIYRIFFSTRDSEGQSHVAYLDVDIDNPEHILSLSDKPVLSPGAVGLFDDCGVVPSCVVELPAGLALFYWGCSLSVTTPFDAFLGLALLNKERDSASRLSSAPLIDRTADDPYSNGAGFVCADRRDTGFHLWFERQEWLEDADSLERHSVGIKHASSSDGMTWSRSPGFSLPPLTPGSILATPCVLAIDDGYRMWFSYKVQGKYRIGGADSFDGLSWSRKDETLGMLASGSGWDGQEVEYPNVFEHDGSLIMLYNGDGYGRTGFGMAVWTSP